MELPAFEGRHRPSGDADERWIDLGVYFPQLEGYEISNMGYMTNYKQEYYEIPEELHVCHEGNKKTFRMRVVVADCFIPKSDDHRYVIIKDKNCRPLITVSNLQRVTKKPPKPHVKAVKNEAEPIGIDEKQSVEEIIVPPPKVVWKVVHPMQMFIKSLSKTAEYFYSESKEECIKWVKVRADYMLERQLNDIPINFDLEPKRVETLLF